jgi:hypothetical protein
VNLLGDVDADADAHSPLQALIKARRAAHAVIALQSDQWQSLISGRGGLALPGICRQNHSMQPA